jgi:hypothetical protein
VRGEIRAAHEAAVLPHIRGDPIGERTVVEYPRSFCGDRLERSREVALDKDVADPRRAAAR